MNHGDPISKLALLRALEMLDSLHPSEVYCSIKEQDDLPDSEWTLRYGYDCGDETGRLLTDKQLRLIILKALAYDDLVKTVEEEVEKLLNRQ